MTDETICGSCTWWEIDRTIKPRGGFRTKECRRHAPVVTVRDDKAYTSWPTTTEYQFCGDWEPMEDFEEAEDAETE